MNTIKSILNWIVQRIKDIASRSWENNKIVHQKALKKSENILRLVIAIFILLIFSYSLIPDVPGLGLSFFFAGLMAIYAGYIYKGEHVMGYVLAGVILASVIPSFLPGISDSYKKSDYIGMLVLILFGMFIWYFSSRLKKGEIPDFEEQSTRKRTRKRR